MGYRLDWLVVVLSLGVFLALEHLVSPSYQLFYADDRTISFPFALRERVPLWLLLVLAYVVPGCGILLGCAAIHLVHPPTPYHPLPSPHTGDRRRTPPRSGVSPPPPAKGRSRTRTRLHASLLGLCASGALAVFATSVVKNAVGRPRPDMLSRCDVMPGTSTTYPVDVTVCRTFNDEVHKTLDEGFRSFPSGHSSSAFAGLGFGALWLGGQVGLVAPPPHRHTHGGVGVGGQLRRPRMWRTFLCLGPLWLAVYIAASRVADHRHHTSDVVVGAVVGLAAAWLAYRQYFPSPMDPINNDTDGGRGRCWDEIYDELAEGHGGHAVDQEAALGH
ncbi:hypothetical protein PYCC9005_001832 [Savitreella phatthalungensis]